MADYCAGCMESRPRWPTGFGCPSIITAAPPATANRALTQHFAGRLADQGYIREVVEKQVFSHADNRFLPDRYIEGTCPNCGYDKARCGISAKTAPSSWTRQT